MKAEDRKVDASKLTTQISPRFRRHGRRATREPSRRLQAWPHVWKLRRQRWRRRYGGGIRQMLLMLLHNFLTLPSCPSHCPYQRERPSAKAASSFVEVAPLRLVLPIDAIWV